jgi:hypothetical protein
MNTRKFKVEPGEDVKEFVLIKGSWNDEILQRKWATDRQTHYIICGFMEIRRGVAQLVLKHLTETGFFDKSLPRKPRRKTAIQKETLL